MRDREHRLAAGSASANHPEADRAPDRSAAQDRCDKCGTPKAQWAEKPCVKSLTQSYRCKDCGNPVTVAHAAAWPSQCPHCKAAPPTLIVKVPS